MWRSGGVTNGNFDVVDDMSPALVDVIAERRRQVEKEGWTPEHDDQHCDGSLREAAAVYAFYAGHPNRGSARGLWSMWPRKWSAGWYKPTSTRRDLVKAAALLLAELERLDRADARKREHARTTQS